MQVEQAEAIWQMCGITGWIDWETDLTRHRPTLEAMGATLAQRGPDAAGYWVTPRAALGHRRLIVVDPEGGAQPMVRQLGEHTYAITYNGQLYNARELRSELEAAGHLFRTRSDTEVMLVAYIEWGPSFLTRLNGIFALGIWDGRAERLLLARDRLGIKPLFYAQRGSSFLFASELKALLAHPAVEPEVDQEGLAEVFYLGPSRTPGHGIYRGVYEVLPGHSLLHTESGTRSERYWRLESHPHPDDLPTTVANVRWLLADAVQRQLVADVPLATLLSGGLDSSAVTALAADVFASEGLGTLHTFSVDYRENDRFFEANDFQPNADGPYARQVSEFLGTEHKTVLLDGDDLVQTLERATIARDLPGMADVDASLLLFCEAIKPSATVILSGECADEIFGGYPWFHRPEALSAQTFPWIRLLPERARLLNSDLTPAIDPETYVAERYHQTLAEVPRLAGEEPTEARRRELFYLNQQWFMATLLNRKDRMSMRAGLEARVPFADHRLVEYVWNVPWAMKALGGREKGLLREALRGILPEEVRERKKSPFPKTYNPAYFRAVRDRVLAILDDPASRLHDVVDAPAIRKFAQQESSAAGMPWFGQLMGGAQFFAYLVQVETWLSTYRVKLV